MLMMMTMMVTMTMMMVETMTMMVIMARMVATIKASDDGDGKRRPDDISLPMYLRNVLK